MGARKGRDETMFWEIPVSLFIFLFNFLFLTYPDVELDDAPENKHGRVSITKLDAVDLEVPEDGAQSREQAEQEDANQADLLVPADVELEQQRDGQDGHDDVRDDGDGRVPRERRAGGQAGAGLERVPRLVDGVAGEEEGERAAQVREEDGADGDPDDAAVDALAGALEEAQVADEERDLEEADAELVERPSGVVPARVGDEVCLGAELDGETEAVSGLCPMVVSIRGLEGVGPARCDEYVNSRTMQMME
jgi:hypothetical protein